MFDFFSASTYPVIWYWMIALLCLWGSFAYMKSSNTALLLKERHYIMTYFFVVMLILFYGLRPVSYVFGDTGNYAVSYKNAVESHNSFYELKFDEEWLFGLLRWTCIELKLDVKIFFLIIEVFYLGCQYWVCKKLLWENTWLAMLFMLSAFSCFSYGTNGIRNGMACAMVMLAIAYAAKDKNYIVAATICFLASGVHRSTLLPTTALWIAIFIIKNPKYALIFWLVAIPISLVAGEPIMKFFMNLGFDDRMSGYGSGATDKGVEFAYTGFRWDFLLYSSMPVLMTWYVNQKCTKFASLTNKQDNSVPDGTGVIADSESLRVFNTISTVYLLCNSFWIMVINASYSNRFAYLSWFIYPLILAYAVIRLHIWDDQDRKAGIILLAHATFTFFMYLIGK